MGEFPTVTHGSHSKEYVLVTKQDYEKTLSFFQADGYWHSYVNDILIGYVGEWDRDDEDCIHYDHFILKEYRDKFLNKENE